MKFLADMNMSMSTVHYLRNQGYDAVHLHEKGMAQASDITVVLKAKEEKRIVLTFDLDFGDLMACSKESLPSIVIFRLRDETPQAVLPHLKDVLENYSEELKKGALVIAGNNRNRIRRLPLLFQDEE